MSDSTTPPDILPQRLCSEIQLFDLCERDSCTSKNGRFCTDTYMLGKFEKIAENELRIAERSISGEFEADEADSDEFSDGDDDGFEMGYFEDDENDDRGEEDL